MDLQTEEELGSLLQGQLARLRRSWNPDVFIKEELFVDDDECFDDLPKRQRSN